MQPYRGYRSLNTDGQTNLQDIRRPKQPHFPIYCYMWHPQEPLLYVPVTWNPDPTRTYILYYTSTYPLVLYMATPKLLLSPFPHHKPWLEKRHFANASAVIGISIFALLPISDLIRLTITIQSNSVFLIWFDYHCTNFIFNLSHSIPEPPESRPRESRIG